MGEFSKAWADTAIPAMSKSTLRASQPFMELFIKGRLAFGKGGNEAKEGSDMLRKVCNGLHISHGADAEGALTTATCACVCCVLQNWPASRLWVLALCAAQSRIEHSCIRSRGADAMTQHLLHEHT